MKFHFLAGVALLAAVIGLNSRTVAAAQSAPELIQALGCRGCHVIQGSGGTLAPDLTQIGSRMTVEQIKSHLTAAPETRTGGFMPSYATLPENDLNAISQHLYNLR